MYEISGFELMENKYLCKYIRKRKSRFKLVDWIYRKIFGYYEVPNREYYIDKINRRIIGHPEIIKEIIKSITGGGIS
jgi:hypothetical protein